MLASMLGRISVLKHTGSSEERTLVKRLRNLLVKKKFAHIKLGFIRAFV